MDRIKRDTLLGLVFFGTLGLLLWATINLTDLSFGRVPPLTVFFQDARGLRTGDAVLVLGKRIGKVGDVKFRADRQALRIQVVLRLDEEIVLGIDYKIEIQDSSVLGGKQVQIDPGLGEPLRGGGELKGTSAGNALERVAQPFMGEGPVGEELKAALTAAKEWFQHMSDPDTSIGAIVRSRALYDEILGTVQSLRRLVQATEEGQGLLGRVIKDTAMRDDAMVFLANLRALSESLRSTDGVAGRLINDRDLSNKVAQMVDDLGVMIADARAGKGTFGAILRDETMASDLKETLARLNGILVKASDPKAGAIGMLLNDPDAATDLKQAFANARQAIEKINAGEGLLAMLINDRDIALRLRRIFTQVSRAIEDAREAAPIGNFAQVLTGVF
jgi:ABC-type transporter Mla subunit MlaD